MSLFIRDIRLGKGSFQIKVLTLVQLIMENRLRHARGPVHLDRVRHMYAAGEKVNGNVSSLICHFKKNIRHKFSWIKFHFFIFFLTVLKLAHEPKTT